MPLDVSTLNSSILQAFQDAKKTPPPSDPSQASNVQDQILTNLAQALSSAINVFVRSGDVVQVTVDVTDPTNKKIGTGTQTGVGKIQ
jgi:hypothetical protein